LSTRRRESQYDGHPWRQRRFHDSRRQHDAARRGIAADRARWRRPRPWSGRTARLAGLGLSPACVRLHAGKARMPASANHALRIAGATASQFVARAGPSRAVERG
jgi:hypothetical protein